MYPEERKQNPTNIAPLIEWRQALDQAWRYEDAPQPDCLDRPDLFVDYHPALPTASEARALCSQCPLLELCGKSARYERPAWGIRAGLVWVGGRQASDKDRRDYLRQLAGHDDAGWSMIPEDERKHQRAPFQREPKGDTE